ncbi:MAG: MFS transporter [Verrucomicrobiota bacterium]
MPASANKRRAIGAVFLILFIDLMGFSIIFPLFPEMLEYYLSKAEPGSLLDQLEKWLETVTPELENKRFLVAVLFGGILGSLYSILQFIFSPIWGKLSDRLGRRRVLLITVTGTALSYLGWIFAGDFWILIATRALAGIMSGNISVASAAVSDLTDEKNRTKGMAVIGIAFALGFLIGPAIGGLSAQWNWVGCDRGLEAYGLNPFSAPAAIAFILAVINLIWIRRGFQETLPEQNRAEAIAREKDEPKRISGLFHIPLPDIKRACMLNLLFTASFAGMEFTLTFLAVERFAYSTLDNGLMFVFIGFWLIITQGGIVRRLAPKVGEKKLTLAGIACAVIAFSLIAVSETETVFYIALAFFALGAGLVFASLSGLVSLYADPSEQGKYLGLYRSAGALARAFGPISAALIYFTFGSTYCYIVGTAVMVVPLMIALKLRQPSKE